MCGHVINGKKKIIFSIIKGITVEFVQQSAPWIKSNKKDVE